MNIPDIIKNGEIDIDEQTWKILNDELSRDEIKKLISDTIVSKNVPLPMRQITEQQARDSFEDLKQLNLNDVVVEKKWTPRYEYSDKFKRDDVVLKSTNVGNIASDYFHQYNRWMCGSVNAPSPYRTWTEEKFRMTLLNGLWSLKYKKVGTNELRGLIGLRKYISSQFRPSAAKAVYEMFNSQEVLDFSSGWGDRLCGFMASKAILYHGIDPNIHLFVGYNKQMKTFNSKGSKSIQMCNDVAENPEVYKNTMYDTVFTSPPYFNIERYTEDENQSFKKYRKIDAWLDKFLFVAVENAWEKIKPNGHLIINISDVYSNHRINKICDPMNNFIETLSGANYVGCYGYEMRKRPNSGALKNTDGAFAEPMWIWQKK